MMVMCGTIRKGKTATFPPLGEGAVNGLSTETWIPSAAEGMAALRLCTVDQLIPGKPEKSKLRATVEAARANSRT